MWVAIQHAEAVSILRSAVVVGEGSSRLDLLSEGPPLSLFDMLLATGGGGLGTWCSMVVCCFSIVLLSSWMWVLPFLFLVFPPFLGALIHIWLTGFHCYFSIWMGEPNIQGNKACILLNDSIYTSGFLGGLYRFVRCLPTFFKLLYTRE